MPLAIFVALAVQSATARALPGDVRTYTDWVVGCDNGLACKAVAVAPEGATADPPLVITVDRAPGADGETIVQISGEDRPIVGRVSLMVDGRAIAAATASDGAVRIGGMPGLDAARAIANGRRVELRGAAGRWSGASLAGAAAALRDMDARQGRAGSRGAIVARGTAADMAPAPPLPVVRRRGETGGQVRPGRALIADMAAQAACSDRAREVEAISVHPLDRGRSLVLLPCQLGAYNSVSAIFVVERGRARPAPFDSAVPLSDNGRVPSLLNVDFDEGVLGGYGKGRGLGDCGIGEDHVWDGDRFRLISRREMPVCRGTRELITTWRAVVR
ncbi:hypothetical protein GGR88_002500 [Sphingomonas jejuensis]|uniref:DUF1176 domain-containing protein n=1 Tax=Sphingomonas jejuensis TaxID=904715 RepID=A0ABX0XQL3_9SPHN|nr:DUF1176 domain-containing protein [Sphingomonas jejuensis]NJC34986.1 hypothetical protein [Sphingomonas jejuensis]